MGEYAEMLLDGTLDEETGEYIGDYNLAKYGTESPGFPVSIEREARERKEERKEQKAINIAKNEAQRKTRCPDCNKKVKIIGLDDHRRVVHNIKEVL